MKDYYEILEVNPKASKEIIDKAYKVLAKKYHPDLQQEANKKNSEIKMQEINEAYEVLSDDAKRKEYDNQLEEQKRIEIEREIEKEQEKTRNPNINTYTNVNTQMSSNTTSRNQPQRYTRRVAFTKEELKEQEKREKQERKRQIEEQERIYRNYMRSLGYRVKERWKWKKLLRLIETIGIIIVVILIVWLFPPTHKLLIELYEENTIIKAIMDIIISIIKGIGNGIGAFFKGIFRIQ